MYELRDISGLDEEIAFVIAVDKDKEREIVPQLTKRGFINII